MAKRELLAGYTHEIAKMLGVTPSESSHGVQIEAQIDSFGRKISFENNLATPAVMVCDIVIRDPETNRVRDAIDLIGAEFKASPGGGVRIVDTKKDSLIVYPNSPAKVHRSQHPARY